MCSFCNRHQCTFGVQALKVISRCKGREGWSKPAMITEANGATSKARMVWAGRSTYIIYHDRRGKFFTRTISQGPTDAEGD
jgi:hypothetical protein